MRLPATVSVVLAHARGPAGLTDDQSGSLLTIYWPHLVMPAVVIVAVLAVGIAYGRWLYRVWRDRADYPAHQAAQPCMWFCPRCLTPAEEPAGLSGECPCGAELAVVGPDGFEVTSWR